MKVPPREGAVRCLGAKGFHRMHYTDWGDPACRRILLCVHGLTRTGRDFDALAARMSEHYRVVCPDIVGRGRSDWLASGELYNYPQYMSDITALVAHITSDATDAVDWIGTSMGGLLGIVLASLPGHPIGKLVINDVGAVVPRAALERIATYAGNTGPFASFDAALAHLRRVLAPFGPLTDEQWLHLATHSTIENADGTWRARHDPAIAHGLTGVASDVDLRAQWSAVTCPTLLLRGEHSDVLPATISDEMTTSGPHATLVTVAGVGHAPALMDEQQIALVREFLLADAT